MNRRLKTGANVVFYTALVFGCVVLANLLSSRLFERFDLTERQIYTLSDASKQVVRALPDRMTLKAFLSKHQELARTSRYVRDLLEEYETYSKGKLAWSAVDPEQDAAAKQEASRMKVQQVRLQEIGSSKFSVQTAYIGIGFQYQGAIESIPVVNPNDLAALEYEVTSLIKRMTQPKKKIAFAQGHGEPTRGQGLQALSGALDQYDLQNLDLAAEDAALPEDIDALLVIGPTERFGERALLAIDQLVMRGKSLAVLLDGMVLETPRGQMPPDQLPPQIARTNDVGLGDLLKHYGVAVRNDMVLDEQSALVFMQVGPGQIMPLNYPGYPIVTNLDRKNPAVKDLRAIIPVFPSSLEIAADGKKGLEVQVLARTTPRAWRQSEIFLFDPLHAPTPSEERGEYAIAAALKGKPTSYFAGKPAPPSGEEAAESAPPEATAAVSDARILVIGDSELARDENLRKFGRDMAQANFTFLLNLIDWLVQDEALIAVRSKSETHRPLEQVPEDKVKLVKYANTVGVPFALVIFGLARWRVRRGRRARPKAD